jgi:galactokinase
VWTAPGRVNLIGEHTDYNDGFVLPFAIPRRVEVAAARRHDSIIRAITRQHPNPGWTAYVEGVAWALRDAGQSIGGADLLVDGDVPIGAGLSSSAALECATALALNDLYDANLTPAELANLARKAENEFVGVPCGPMDQLVAMQGRMDHALFIDTRTLTIQPVPLDLPGAGLALVVINTNAPHSLPSSAYRERRQACENAARLLHVPALRNVPVEGLDDAIRTLEDPFMQKRVRHVVTENARVQSTVEMLATGNIAAIGPLLTASHVSLRDDYQVSSPELDAAVDAALEAGACGARMTGAGFGGCAIALIPVAACGAVADAVDRVFRDRTLSPPECFTVTPAEGARRLPVT